jgi:methylated-DNA-[protein]-cysteine S-methyltransferase
MTKIAKKVYDLLKKIPQGKVTTYKVIAGEIGTKGYQAIGQIIGANPNAPEVPCHRVVKSDGKISGYAFGVDEKIKILAKEGVKVSDGKVVDFENKFYKF